MAPRKMRWNASFAMAVGGMVGGGIFSVLGVVVAAAGEWAWLSFVIAAGIALLTASSYVALTGCYRDGGGVFTCLQEAGKRRSARVLSWLLVAGYVLTMALYAFTLGHYGALLLGGGPLLQRVIAAGAVAAFTAVNVVGVKESARAEIVAVWTKLAVLVLLAVVGLARWAPERLGEGVSEAGPRGVLVGAAAIFVAFQGFELLTYDYDEIRNPRWTLPRAILPAIATAGVLYIAVAAAAAMLVGGGDLVARKEVALAVAGQAAAGAPGRVVVSLAAVLSAASAINATLFGTSRLCRKVAEEGDLPRYFTRTNDAGVPALGIVTLGAAGAVLAVVGSLGALVEASSLTFLATFAIVNVAAATRVPTRRALAVAGAVAATAAALVVVARLCQVAAVTDVTREASSMTMTTLGGGG